MPTDIDNIVQHYLNPAKDHIYGFADLTGLLPEKFKGFDYGICIGYRLNDNIVDNIKDGPTTEYYDHYNKVNDHLTNLAKKISDDLEKNSIKTQLIVPTVSMSESAKEYNRTLRTDLSHKMVATRAGLGWIGKTDLFISEKFGPRLRLTTVLIGTKVSPKHKPIDKSRCGKCTKCVDACPAMASTGRIWDIHTDRDEFFDPWKCREKCAEYGEKRLGKDVRICGICIAVCPIGIV